MQQLFRGLEQGKHLAGIVEGSNFALQLRQVALAWCTHLLHKRQLTGRRTLVLLEKLVLPVWGEDTVEQLHILGSKEYIDFYK